MKFCLKKIYCVCSNTLSALTVKITKDNVPATNGKKSCIYMSRYFYLPRGKTVPNKNSRGSRRTLFVVIVSSEVNTDKGRLSVVITTHPSLGTRLSCSGTTKSSGRFLNAPHLSQFTSMTQTMGKKNTSIFVFQCCQTRWNMRELFVFQCRVFNVFFPASKVQSFSLYNFHVFSLLG